MKAFSIIRFPIQILFTAGLTLLLVFIILSGVIDSSPINKFYWVQADTSSISGAPALSRWTYWGLSENTNGVNQFVVREPAYPISPVDNFGTTDGIPTDFVDNRNTYYYLSRVAWGCYIVALAATFFYLVFSVFALCSTTIALTSSVLIILSFVFTFAATAMYTAVAVLTRNKFNNAGMSAKVGPAMMGIAWASCALVLILFLISFGHICAIGYKKHRDALREDDEARARYEEAVQRKELRDAEREGKNTNAATAGFEQNQGTIPAATESTGIKFFKIKRNNKEFSESD